MKKLLLLSLILSVPAFGQSNYGELRLKVTDPSGLGSKAQVRIVSEANHYARLLTTAADGRLLAERLPFGLYHLDVTEAGFASVSESIEIRSAIPMGTTIQLKLSSTNESVTVTSPDTLIDPDQAGSVNQIGATDIQNRLGSIPGRDLQDLVNSQPGWLYEGNAVLHPRGSEYQTQFVIDGIPLTDDRSPSFGPEIEADDVQSMSIYTAGIPAEYGRKMGGVVEVNTLPDTQAGLHGQVALSGGSFDSGGAFGKGQYVWGKNTIGGSASGSFTSHYLNPVVTQNYTNTGTLGDFSLDYVRQFSPNDRLKMSVRHEIARYDIPNEAVQQAAGQQQNADNFETMGIVSYQHTFSSNATGELHGMARDNSNDFYSNPASVPVYVTQHNSFREGYFRGVYTYNHGHQELKGGVETDNMFLHENTCYTTTEDDDDDVSRPFPASAGRSNQAGLDQARLGRGGINPSLLRSPRANADASFADGCNAVGVTVGNAPFIFEDQRPDLEQSVFVQDLIRLHNWTISAGLRWDHYQLVLNKQQVQPRFSISRYIPQANTVLHFSYDRIFQTPSFENILLSSSTQVESIDPTDFLRLPVKPSVGDYFEGGLSTVFAKHVKLDANYFRRVVSDYADDDQIDSTSISFPISFRKAIIYGMEGKLTVPDWHHVSGFASYSYIVGNVWNPVTGGLFLGDDADAAAAALTGHFPDSQDQRHTLRARTRYQVIPRLWIAGGVQYDTGLPFEFSCDPSLTTAQCIQGQAELYGQDVVNRINFARGRILPSFQVNASAGADLYTSDRLKMHLQADGENLTNVIDVIDFGGLFSGNAIGPSRSFSLRLITSF